MTRTHKAMKLIPGKSMKTTKLRVRRRCQSNFDAAKGWEVNATIEDMRQMIQEEAWVGYCISKGAC